MTKPNKKIVTVLKIIISVVLLYFVFTKIAFEDVLDALKKSDPICLSIALIYFIISKIIASFRINLYFRQLQVYLTQLSNLKLYLLGMFYNLFLPGGIGGDAYKGYTIRKQFPVETKKVVAVLILDRLSGLLLLFIYASVLIVFLEVPMGRYIEVSVLLATLLSIVVFWLLNKHFFQYLLPIFWQAFGLSALVQLFQLLSALYILKALAIELQTVSYLFIFLASSIVSVIPLTLGGIGSRELTFYYGAALLNLDKNSSIGVSMLFFLITAAVSFCGIFYHFKKPELKTK